MNGLARCPLCGKEVEHNIIPHFHHSVKILELHQIKCKCGLMIETRISPTAYRHDELVQEFIDKWNHREGTNEATG